MLRLLHYSSHLQNQLWRLGRLRAGWRLSLPLSLHLASSGFLLVTWPQGSWTPHTAALLQEEAEAPILLKAWPGVRAIARATTWSVSHGVGPDSRGGEIGSVSWCEEWRLSLETIRSEHSGGSSRVAWLPCDCPQNVPTGMTTKAVCEFGRYYTLLASHLMQLTR